MICRQPIEIGDRDSIEILNRQMAREEWRDFSAYRPNNYLVDRVCLLRATRNAMLILMALGALIAAVVWLIRII